MPKRTKDGEKSYKTVIFYWEPPASYVPTGNPQEMRRRFVAAPGTAYSEENMEALVETCIEFLDKTFPNWNFRMVRIKANEYKFIYDGLRAGFFVNDSEVATTSDSA